MLHGLLCSYHSQAISNWYFRHFEDKKTDQEAWFWHDRECSAALAGSALKLTVNRLGNLPFLCFALPDEVCQLLNSPMRVTRPLRSSCLELIGHVDPLALELDRGSTHGPIPAAGATVFSECIWSRRYRKTRCHGLSSFRVKEADISRGPGDAGTGRRWQALHHVPLGQTKRSSRDSEWIRTSDIEENPQIPSVSSTFLWHPSKELWCVPTWQLQKWTIFFKMVQTIHPRLDVLDVNDVSLAKVLSSLRCRRGTIIESWSLVEWAHSCLWHSEGVWKLMKLLIFHMYIIYSYTIRIWGSSWIFMDFCGFFPPLECWVLDPCGSDRRLQWALWGWSIANQCEEMWRVCEHETQWYTLGNPNF